VLLSSEKLLIYLDVAVRIFRFLVGMSAASAAYSLAHLLLIAHKAVKKVPMVPSRRQAWLLFAGDQVCRFLVILM
jgi:hypothetical protein